MSTVITNTTVFTNKAFPFDKIELSDLEKRNRKYYVDYTVESMPIFLQINKVKLESEPIFIDDEQGYIDVRITDRINEFNNYFNELDNYNQIVCFKNCKKWLNKTFEINEIEKVYKSSFNKLNNSLRVKIEKNSATVYDMKRNKLNLDSDIKVGDTLDIILELSGLKIMKSAFGSHILLRQIRKHPNILPIKRTLPNEYLFLDEYSRVNNVFDEGSLDSQTDVDVIISSKKSNLGSLKKIQKVIEEDNEETEKDRKDLEKIRNIMDNVLEDSSNSPLDIPKDNEEVNEQESDSDSEGIFSKISKKDRILDDLENANSILDSIANPTQTKHILIKKNTDEAIKTSKGKRGKAKSTYNENELFKNI
jgi:hypothetical protein